MASIELSLASNAIALQNTIENGALGELGRSFGLQGGKRPGDAVFSLLVRPGAILLALMESGRQVSPPRLASPRPFEPGQES